MDAKGADKKSGNGKRKLSFLSFAQRRSVDGHGSETIQALDEEMEKVFAMESIDKFNVALLGSDSESTGLDREHREPPTRYGNYDIEQHRKKSYPHPYMPLKSIHSRSMRRHLSPNREGSETTEVNPEEESATAAESEVDVLDNGEAHVESQNGHDEDNATDNDDFTLNSPPPRTGEGEPQISERAAAAPGETSPVGSPRVQFQQVKDENSGAPPRPDSGSDEERSRRRRHKTEPKRNQYYHKSRKYSLQEDPECRKRVGGIQTSELTGPFARRVSVQPDEASTLQELDIDDLESHRSDDPRGLRRHKTHNTVQIGRRRDLPHFEIGKKRYDHSPHEVFVQLDELRGVGEEREWCETARWIKYEEDVEEGAARWGQPHVASLSFHSLLNLRRCLETGVVLFDVEDKDLPGVAYRIVEQMVTDDLILPSDRPVIMRALLLRHRHVNDHDRGFRFGSKRNYSSYTSLQSVWLEDDDAAREVAESHNLNDSKQKMTTSNSNLEGNNHVVDMKEELTFTSSSEDLKAKQHNDNILKRIPAGAEATVVLVGAVDFLDQPTIAFVRLAEGVPMPSITEVTIPVRFMFTLLGPRNSDLDYHEIGRSISTLMSNGSFHKLAYRATERRELLSAINEFLDDSIVLPPGDWERQALLPFQELRAKSIAIKQRKVKAMEESKKKQQEIQSRDVTIKKAPLVSDDERKPPDDDPLRRTRRPFGGLIKDIKRRYPFYMSDLTDGLNSTCLAAAIFMYFAALCTAITFGGLMSDKTHNLIGISETLVSASFTGVIMALFSTQPLVIIGTTGPLLLFDESLYNFCAAYGLEFLSTRVYIGAWMGVIALTIACVEGSVLVRLFTRFTEEIFTGLISILYIVETFIKLYNYFVRNPLLPQYCFANDSIVDNSTFYSFSDNNTSIDSGLLPRKNFAGLLINQPNTALMCTILCLGTFLGAYYLRIFRNSHYLGRSARRAFGDFGVPISIIMFVLIDYLAGVETEKLLVPQGLTPTQPNRTWIVNPAGTEGNAIPVWIIFASCIPALLVYILVFMETQISELIIDKKERKLRKGNGYHMDIVVVCMLNMICGIFGAPWCCAASVRSLTHVSSVTVMSRTHAPGEKPHVVEVKEQRVSALLVAVLVGVSVSMAPLLRKVPMAVLLGVFLYMGISSTNGVQLFDRIKLFFMPVKHHGSANYVRRVQTYKMHIFTLVQIICLTVLWIVKSTDAALALPFFLILMIPLRAQMRHFFTPAELRALDSKAPDNEDEPDFYEEAPLPG